MYTIHVPIYTHVSWSLSINVITHIHILHTKVGEDVVVVRQVLEPPALDPREVLVDKAAVHLFLLLV